MYYLYGIGAFNEVAFVAMLKAGWIPASTARSPLSAPAFICPHYRRFAGRNSGYRRGNSDWRGLRVPALLLGAGFVFPVANFIASLITGLVIGTAIGYIIILARKFTINQSDSTYGADVMMGPVTLQAVFWGR